MKKYLTDINLFEGEGLRGFGPLGLEGKYSLEAPSIFENFISSTIGIMTIIAAIWFIFVFLSGAIGIISSGGDKTAVETSRKRITSGIIGLVVIIAAIFVIELIGGLIGFDFILNPAEIIIRLGLTS